MRRLRAVGSALGKQAEIGVTLVSLTVLIATIAIWIRAPADLTAIRDYGLLIAAIVAFPLGFWRSRVAERQADATRRQANTAQQSLLSERYRQGAEMLGHDLMSVRLGGIYTLDRLANDYPEEYHILAMQISCAFVRHPPRDSSEFCRGVNVEELAAYGGQKEDVSLRIREDIHAVLQAIRVRSSRRREVESKFHFTMDLSGADIRRADLRSASLSGADLSQSRLSGSRLVDANLSEAQLQYADLTSPNLSRVNIVTNTDMAEGNVPEKTRLDNADLTGALAMGAKMRGVILSNADLSGANFPYVTLADSCLMHANLSKVHLLHADLTGAELFGANLAEAVLSDANLSGTDLSGSCLFGHAGMPRRPVIGLTQKQLDSARADAANPPRLDGVVDAETGCQLVWNEKPLDDER